MLGFTFFHATSHESDDMLMWNINQTNMKYLFDMVKSQNGLLVIVGR